MLNIIKGFVTPTVTELNTNVTLNTKDVSLVNLNSDVSTVIETLIDINNKYMSMLDNGSFLNVAYACFLTGQMYKDKNHFRTIKQGDDFVEYTRQELMNALNPFLTSFKTPKVGKQMKSLMSKLYERKIPLSKILTDGFVISGLQSTITYIDANYELDGKKKVKNTSNDKTSTNKSNKSNDKKTSKDETVNSIDTSKADTVEQAIELHIDMIKKDYQLNDAELANLIIKHLMTNNKKLMTTSNKKTIAFKVA